VEEKRGEPPPADGVARIEDLRGVLELLELIDGRG
jgi:hypothetical protein